MTSVPATQATAGPTTTATPAAAAPAAPATAGAIFAKLLIFVLAIVAVAWAGHSWIAEHDARVKAEASVAASQKSIDSAAAEKKELIDEQKARDAQTASQIDKLAASAAMQKTPQQIVKWLPMQLGPLPAPVKASIAPATPQDPAPPAVFTVPQADLAAMRDQVASCQKNAVALPSAQQDASSCEARAKLSAEQLAAAQDQVKALDLELKGGTFWHRLKSGAKKVGIGVAIGAAAVCASGHCK
jgi:hypothetical protein